MQKLPKQNFHGLLFTLKRSSIRCGIFINFIVVAVFIDYSTSWQHYQRHICYNLVKNLKLNKNLVQ